MKKILPYILAAILTGFGLLILFLSTSVIFDLFGLRAKEGSYVLFVVWSTFISSTIYLFAAHGFLAVKNGLLLFRYYICNYHCCFVAALAYFTITKSKL